MNNTAPFNLFVGFGGAGCKSLAAMAETLSQDFEFGSTVDRMFAFVLVDTDEKEMKLRNRTIRNSLGRHCLDKYLMICEVPLGKPFTAGFSDHIVEIFHKIKDDKGRKRLLEAWWTGKDDRPFSFPAVKDPGQGASQMPLSSRIMAWRNSQEIGRVVNQTVNQFRLRCGPEAEVNMYFVSSLAGGTGRGCWATLSFMFREAFHAHRIKCNPIGVFLDAGCFPAPVPRMLDQPRIKLNSLTGLSELAMWLKNAYEGKDKSVYTLPSFRKPDDESVDVIDTLRACHPGHPELARIKFEEGLHGDPVDQAIVIFRGNSVVPSLSSTDHYPMMVGQLLYSCARSGDFWSEVNNCTDQHLFSAGSSIVSVPAGDILDYMMERAKAILMEKQLERRETDAKGVSGLVARRWAKIQDDLDFGNLLDQLVADIWLESDELSNLADAMEKEQNVTKAVKAAKNIVNEEPSVDGWVGFFFREWHSRLHAEVDHQEVADRCAEQVIDNWLDEAHELLADGIVRRVVNDMTKENDECSLAEIVDVLQIARKWLKTEEAVFRSKSREAVCPKVNLVEIVKK